MNAAMLFERSLYLVIASGLVVVSSPLLAGVSAPVLEELPNQESIPDWVPSVQLGYIHQFDSDIDGGGSFSVDRANVRVGLTRVFDRSRVIGLSLGYGYDGYSFNDSGVEPWSDIHTMRLSVPIRWALSDDWTMFAIPSVRSSMESGASFSDSLSGGFLAGASYAFGDHLTLGPGIGVLSQLEDDASIIPILIIKWKITDSVTLETGRGFGASQGPGLNLSWQASEKWKITFGGQYQKMRFRLDDRGTAPDGVGEERSVPLYLGASYAASKYSEITVYAGAKFGGSLSLDDSSGNRISRSDYDTTLFAGIAWKYGF